MCIYLSIFHVGNLGISNIFVSMVNIYWYKTQLYLLDSFNSSIILTWGRFDLEPIWLGPIWLRPIWFGADLTCFRHLAWQVECRSMDYPILLYSTNKVFQGPSWSWSYAVWKLDLQLPVQSMPITTKVVSSNRAHGEVY